MIYACGCDFSLIFLYLINPRRDARRGLLQLGLSVCVCVCFKSHLTYGASVRPENAVTYSAGNEGQKICGVFSETAPLQRSSTPSVIRPCVQSAIFPCVFLVYAHAFFSCRMIHRRGFSTLVLFISFISTLFPFSHVITSYFFLH